MSDRIAVMYGSEFIDILDAANTTVEEIGLRKSHQPETRSLSHAAAKKSRSHNMA